MDRVIVACPSCKARFDVSSFKPGSKIRCGSCYKILKIPERLEAAPQPAVAQKKVVAPQPSAARRGRRPARSTKAGSGQSAVAPVATPGARAKPGQPPAKRKAVQKAAPAEARPAAKKKAPVAREAPPKKPAPATETLPPPKKAGDPLIGHRLNDEFELVRKIGEGGYGSVYEATDLTLRRRVACKLMLSEKTTNKEFVAKFLREARTAAQLNHPNIVKIHLVGFSKELGQHFLAMEFVEGKTLSDIMSEDGAFPVERAVDVVIQSAIGLGQAHRRNIVHRDIKPGNIMITPKGVVKVADFGLAKVYDPEGAASTVIGTPYFMPPEQFDGKVKDGRSDIYSLGVTFYYILTLKRPFDGNTPARVLMNILTKEPVNPKEHNPKVPDGIWAVIKKMLARNVDERYTTCEELLRDLKGYQEAADSEEKVFCPSCGFGNPFSAEKCIECSTSLLEPCPSCGTPDHVGAKFCGNCGANLAQEKEIAGLVAEAEADFAGGRIEKAIEKYHAAREVSPENSQVVEGMRRVEQALTERDEAYSSIRALVEKGSFAEAVPLVEDAVERFPGFDRLVDLQAKALDGAREGRLAEALEEAQALQESGDLLDACAAARRALDIAPDSERARERLDQAEQARDAHAAARERAARLEEDLRLTEALQAWQEALAAAPGDEAAGQAVSRIQGILEQVAKLRNRAEEALEQADLQLARSALEDAFGVCPDDPETLELVATLRSREDAYRTGLVSALENLLGGRFSVGADGLEALAAEYPADERLAKTGSLAKVLGEAHSHFLEEGVQLVAQKRPELAGLYLRAAQKLCPDDAEAATLLDELRAVKKAEVAGLAAVRGMIQDGEFDEALERLRDLGGATSPNPEVGSLTLKAGEGRREKQREEREERRRVIEASLDTARSLLDSGRPQAGLAACQKALRLDRNHAGARALKDEIDAAITKIEERTNEPSDTGIETGAFDMDARE